MAEEAATPVDGAAGQADTAAAGQSELDLGVVPTGSAEVDAALRPLDQLAERAVGEHAAVYERVLDALTTTMTSTAETGAEPHEGDG